jgi:hypothetical protein
VTQILVTVDVAGYAVPEEAATLEVETRETDGRPHDVGIISLTSAASYSFGVVPRSSALEPAWITVLVIDPGGFTIDSWSDTVEFRDGETVNVDIIFPTASLSDAGMDATPDAGCGVGLRDCGTGCTDLRTNDANCGVCGLACASNESCSMGRCILSGCPTGEDLCDGICIDTLYDAQNCGGCDVLCGASEWCLDGSCRDCDTSSDCPMGFFCLMGRCTLEGCSTWETECATALCVDLYTDPDHCGECFNTCPVRCHRGVCNDEICGNLIDDDMDTFVDEGC